MSKTNSDWAFSTYVHQHFAVPHIYDRMGWRIVERSMEEAREMDINHGIDYLLEDIDGQLINVQERFRDNFYGDKYNDATLRFKRANNTHPERISSEFYKIKAKYLVYGICNGSKSDQTNITGFIKWVVVDIPFLQQKFKDGLLIIGDTRSKYCIQDGNTMICPENFNPDGSSSFIPLDVKIMHTLWGNAPVLHQIGFL